MTKFTWVTILIFFSFLTVCSAESSVQKYNDNSRTITSGSSKEEVLSAIGSPKSIKKIEIWEYSNSYGVIFENNKVYTSYNQSKNALNAITLGSSKEEVVAIHGTPDAIRNYTYFEVWEYGRSNLTFKNEKVFEWDNKGELITLIAKNSNYNTPKKQYKSSSHFPQSAENGSYYGEISSRTGRPKTTYVNGYYRKDGTYVRSHYRSKK